MAQSRTSRKDVQSTPDIPDSPAGIRWRAGLIVLAGIFAYSNSLSGPFIFDDRFSIVENQHIREWWRLGSSLFPEADTPTAGRPLVNLSFALNYAVGGLGVSGYHLVNIAFHLLSALTVFGIVRRTLELPGLKNRFAGWSTNLGLAVALLWTLHPLNTDAVDYLTERTELMMALCYLLTLYAGIRAWQSRAAALGWEAIALVSCTAGMACKESMATAPLMMMLYDRIFLFDSLKQAIRSRWRFYAALGISWVVLAAVLWSGPRVHSAGFSSCACPWTYLLDQTVMITQYLRLAVWPRELVANYGWVFPATLGDVLPYALFIACLLVLTIVALIRQPKWGFLGAWLFMTLAPTSSIVPIATEVGAERRMYLPLVALVVLAVVAASFVRHVGAAGKAVALVLVSAALLAGTFTRNRDYTSALRLARTVVERHPTGVGHLALATELLDAGDRDEAMVHLRQALPDAPRAHYTLGVELFRDGRLNEAIDELQAFVREQPLLIQAVSARQLLGRAFASQQRWPEAVEQYRMVLTMNPSSVQRVETDGLLAAAELGAQSFADAAVHYAEYLKVHPDDVGELNNLGIALIAADRLDEALGVFRHAVDVDPDDAGGQRNFANALFDHRDIDEAAVHAQRAVDLRPGDPAAHDLLGRVLAVQGRLQDAQGQFEEALRIKPDYADAKVDLDKLRRLSSRASSPAASPSR
jgi:tetratricopeptide (TPR) repeat protein